MNTKTVLNPEAWAEQTFGQVQLRDMRRTRRAVLAVQDTTEIDLSYRSKMTGIGQIGNAKGRGFHLQTVLAVQPETRAVLGCVAQKPFVRIPAPKNEQRYQRRHREQRETDVWMRDGSSTLAPLLPMACWCMWGIEERICFLSFGLASRPGPTLW